MKNKSEMGQHFAERFKDFSLEPSPEVWSNVSRNIPLKNTPMISTQMWLISAAAAIVIGLAALVLVNSREDSTAISEQSNSVEQSITLQPSTPESKPNSLSISSTPDSTENDLADTENSSEASISLKQPAENDVDKSENDVEVTSNTTQSVVNKEHSETIKPTIEIPSKPVITSPTENPNTNQTRKEDDNLNTDPVVSQTEVKKDTTIKFSANPTVCFGESARLSVQGGEYYLWSSGSAGSAITVEPVNQSTYTVTVTDKYNYQHIHKYTVSVDRECTAVFLPSAFTPNGDGNNDVYKAVGEGIQDFKMQIMNRKGMLLFQTNDINTGWDGTFNGSLQPAQVYIYTVVYENARGEQKVLNGQFTLVR